MLLGEEEDTSTPSRRIYVNDPIKNGLQKFLHNRITTGKYNLVTFLPLFLWEQFSKYANLFFLFIACIQVRFRKKKFFFLQKYFLQKYIIANSRYFTYQSFWYCYPSFNCCFDFSSKRSHGRFEKTQS
jgi:hypothetical protein